MAPMDQRCHSTISLVIKTSSSSTTSCSAQTLSEGAKDARLWVRVPIIALFALNNVSQHFEADKFLYH